MIKYYINIINNSNKYTVAALKTAEKYLITHYKEYIDYEKKINK